MPSEDRQTFIAHLKHHFSQEVVDLPVSRNQRHNVSHAKDSSIATSEGEGASVRIGTFLVPRGQPERPELVPQVNFVSIDRHTVLLEEMARALFEQGEQHLLLIGPQGVGKNRVVDHLLQILNLEREYMQLHRDTTVSQLTVTPKVVDGHLLYEDSPLIRAVQHGRVLVLDEADKAPLEVIVVLKSLVEDGQLALPDGRRVAHSARAGSNVEEPRVSDSLVIPIHAGFRMLVLANRPGFPFLGNNLVREADLFRVFCVDNPDTESELQLVRSITNHVSEVVLSSLVSLFSDLRLAVEEGRLQYPYSTRELLAVVRHIDQYPHEPLEHALASILAFDRFDPQARVVLQSIFEKHRIPLTTALSPPYI